MKRKDRKDASPEAAGGGTATPFFARYLEGQDAEAKVSEGRNQAGFTYKEDARGTKRGAKKGGAKSAAAAGNAKAKPPLQTLKYPSDRDEPVFYAYHAEAAEAPTRGARQTLKYPSDNDEDRGYYAVYADAKDAPKSETAKAKPKETGIRLSRKKPKG